MVDDDADACALVCDYLTPHGYQIEIEGDGARGLERALEGNFSLLLLDVMLPGLNGIDVLRCLRERGVSTPILMLSERGEEMDRVIGLELGADDFLPKPYSLRELAARIRALLRRDRSLSSPRLEVLFVGDIQLNVGARTVRCGHNSVEMTAIEFELLAALMRNAGQVVRREELARGVLERELTAFDRSLDVHIGKVRRKLSDCMNCEAPLKTVRGVGFVFTLPGAPS